MKVGLINRTHHFSPVSALLYLTKHKNLG